MNQTSKRQAALLKILHFIQDGGDLETAKKMFKEEFDQVDVSEITKAERALIAGGLDPRQIQYLCNVHVDLFKDNIARSKDNPDFSVPGHPVHTIKLENLVIKSLIEDALLPDFEKLKNGDSDALAKIQKELQDLSQIDKHYARKETSIFPLMNKYGITAPPQVMWGVDDKIRKLISQAIEIANAPKLDMSRLESAIRKVSYEVREMIVKEEQIMIPMLDQVASAQDWYSVKQEEDQIGYTLIQKPMNWKVRVEHTQPASDAATFTNLADLILNFKEGKLNLKQLHAILDLLPFAITFIDENDKVAYFGGGAEIFPHSKNALGNSVYSCHLPESVPTVKKILDSFHSGQKDKYEFWFEPKRMKRYLYLQYFAVRDESGQYLGCLEVAQDVTKIRKFKQEKKSL